MNPSFNSLAIRQMAPVFNRKAEKLVSVLEHLANNEPVDITKYVVSANLDVIAGRRMTI